MNWTVEKVIAATQAKTLSVVERDFHGVATDSRQNLKDQIFIALKGDVHDAHDFLEQAQKNQAAALLVHAVTPAVRELADRVTVFVVADTLKALQDMAADYRQRMGFMVVGITGSNGKTTTKEFARDLLQDFKRVHASQGSFNNHWGVPLTLLAAPADTQVVLQEMGMNHAGEITRLSQIAKPNVVVVTMVGSAHIGELGSAEAVAKAKQEIYDQAPGAVAVFNLDNEWTRRMWEHQQKGRPRSLTFSAFNKEADVHLRADRIGLNQMHIVGKIITDGPGTDVRIGGRHNVNNIMAAAAIALALDMPPAQIWQKMAGLKTTWGRGQLLRHASGAQVLFDGYNANPESVAALLRGLLEIDGGGGGGRRVAVLGDMLELGSTAAPAHTAVGELAGSVQLQTIYYVGRHAKDFERGLKKSKFGGQFLHSPQMDAVIATSLAKELRAHDLVVIKGSRGMRMEQILTAWGIKDKT